MKLNNTIKWLVSCWLLMTAAVAGAQQTTLVEATDLAADARQPDKVILLLVSSESCPYCMQIKQDILEPMLLAGDHSDRLLIRELLIDTGALLYDFDGKQISGSDLAHRYGADLTPTQLFLGPDGKELTKRMVGIQTPEFFYFYVDASIKRAIAALDRRSAQMTKTGTAE